MSEKIVQLNEEVIKGQIKELVRGRASWRPRRAAAENDALRQRGEAHLPHLQHDDAHRLPRVRLPSDDLVVFLLWRIEPERLDPSPLCFDVPVFFKVFFFIRCVDHGGPPLPALQNTPNALENNGKSRKKRRARTALSPSH